MIIEDYNPKDFIIIAGARLHNLKNVNVAIPRNAFTVITGVSGSGKSSLAFDTLYAEGQRRYVESLSSYARQFLARLEKPEVDYIKGISPTVAIEQKVVTNNPRSTVATSTEIYELLKLLFARVGRIIDPRTEREVKSDEVEDVVNEILKYQGEKGAVVLPYEYIKDYSAEDLIAQGFSRGSVNGSFVNLSDIEENQSFDLVIERFVVKNSEDFVAQLSDSIELAFSFADGNCEVVFYLKDGKTKTIPFTKSLTKDGITFLQPDLNLFNFNSPIGACEVCEGFGKVLGISEDLVIPDNLSEG
jgi:excinuclease ABC subunit A